MIGSQAHNSEILKVTPMPGRGKPLILEQQPPRETVAQKAQTESAVKWVLENKDGNLQLKPLANTHQVDVTTVSIHPEEVEAPRLLSIFGRKLDITSKVEGYKENYVKNYLLSKSHNLMVARFAELKTSFLGYLLSICGVSSEDIRKLQEKARKEGIHQNQLLFEENEYNAELLSTVGGGGKKQMRAQEKVTNEIRSQLIVQAKNLGLGNHYTQERILEIRINQCRKILTKFVEEKVTLEYQMAYLGIQKSVN